MRFGNQIVMFDFRGIPMVGNLNTGYVIGLTPEQKAICDRLMRGNVAPAEIAAVDETLFRHLGLGGFFGYKKPDGAVKTAYMNITERCTRQCAGCRSCSGDRSAVEDAPTEKFSYAISQLASVGVEQIIIGGGEPFLRDDLAAIAAFAKIECSIASVEVISNGIGLDSQLLKRVAPFVDRVSVLLGERSSGAADALRSTQRSSEVSQALEAIARVNIPAGLVAMLDVRNAGEVPSLLDLAEKFDAPIAFSLLSCPYDEGAFAAGVPDDGGLEALGRALLLHGRGGEPLAVTGSPLEAHLTAKRACGAGVKTISVAADGTVYPCPMLHRADLAMGNLFTDVIHGVLSGEVAQGFRSLATESFERCAGCEYERLCGGGCRARALFATGTLQSADPYCPMIKEFFAGYGDRLKNTPAIRCGR